MAENKKLGERLIDAGLITQDALVQALDQQKQNPKTRLGDCLLQLRLISEQALLRFLAADFQTRYVSTEKLSKVKIATDVLDRVPVRFAEAQALIPILYDEERKALSVVMAEPQNTAAIAELKIVANLREVFVFIGTRAAVNAAIKKFFYGDHSAFDTIGAAAEPPPAGSGGPPQHENTPTTNRSASGIFEGNSGLRVESIQKAAQQSHHVTVSGGISPTSVRQAAEVVQRTSLASDNDFIETLNVLVGLLEMRRKDAFRSHSAAVAKHSRTIAQRMGLEHRTVNHVTIAAYLHDLGKRPDRHLTLLSSSENDEWRTEAKRYYKAPIKLFETVHLPVEVNSILAQLFEAYDGSGFPQGAKGDSIPAGARILAAVDAYEDLAKNGQNVFGKAFDKEEAISRIRDRVGTLFDPAVVDLMLQIHSGDLLKQRLLSEGRQVVVCHGDEGTRTDLKDSLSKLGLITNATASNEGVYEALRNGEADIYIAEVVPPDEEALGIVAPLRREPATVGLPVIFLAAKTDSNLADRVAALRPAELIAGEIDPDQVAARAKALLDDRQAAGAPGRIVAGMLDEMSLPDVLKNISVAKRSGRLLVRGTGKQGEIFIEKGRVVHVVCGANKGEPAFDQISSEFTSGDFTLDPNFLILDQQMDKDVDILLRESNVRRRSRPAPPPAAESATPTPTPTPRPKP